MSLPTLPMQRLRLTRNNKAHRGIAADPIVQYMSYSQLEKSIERTRKLMKEAAKKLNFIEAAQYRDELLKMEEALKAKQGATP